MSTVRQSSFCRPVTRSTTKDIRTPKKRWMKQYIQETTSTSEAPGTAPTVEEADAAVSEQQDDGEEASPKSSTMEVNEDVAPKQKSGRKEHRTSAKKPRKGRKVNEEVPMWKCGRKEDHTYAVNAKKPRKDSKGK